MRAESALPVTSSATGLARAVHEQALRTPRAVALVDGAVRLDYTALDTAAAAVAHGLRRAGVRPGQAVAVCLPRSWQLVCVMLGVLRLGALVVPLDAQSPPERRRHILTDSSSVALVHGGTAPDDLPGRVRPLEAAALLAAPPGDPEAVLGGAPVSFLFYTSGTTGRPKGVEVRDAGILRLARPGYIRIEEGARYACLANPAFDALSFEVWVPLLTGGCCVVLGDEDVQTPHRLAAALLRERIDTAFVTVALFNAVVDTEPSCFAGVGQLLVGGEQLNARLIRRWYRHNAEAPTRLHNVYGPTEATTFALCHPIPRDFDGDLVPIGRVLPQTGAVLVVPDGDRAAAPGEVAELHLSGAGLAAGYRNLPEETERRFVRLPWYDDGRTTHYRTGDLVRADADGLIEYVGRADRQVKVRGFRIEPGELERQIVTHPAVRQAYVCTRRVGEHGPNELLAYVVLGEDVPFEEFDRHLAAGLPGYMRPHHIHLVDALPLNANGKVDQAALLRRNDPPWRRPEGDRPGATVATARQREVLALAAEVLGVPDLRLDDRWIASGGDSLKALRLRFEARRRWGCELPQARVLTGDVAGIARAVAEAGSAADSPYPVPPAPTRARSASATSEQQRLWLLQQRAPRSRAYAVELAFRLEGAVDTDALRASLRGLVRRHAALRTAFAAAPEGLRQLVGDPYDPWTEPGPEAVGPGVAVEGAVVGAVDSDGENGARAEAERFFAVPFDLARPRMLRARWLPQDGGGELLLHLHHIAVDGWSLNVLLEDLSSGYRHAHDGAADEASRRTDTAPVPTPLDYAAWQSDWFASPAYLAQRAELRAHYDRSDEAADHDPGGPSGAVPFPAARLLHTSLDVVRRAAVDRICAELGITRFELLLGVFAWSLYGVTGGTRPRIAAPVANRPVQEFEGSVGMFANTVLLPQAVAPREDLRGQLLRLSAGARQVLDRQEVALADVLADREPAGGHSPFDYLFVLENTDFGALALPGCASRPLWWAPAEAKCPMTLSVVEHAGGLDCLWEYADDRFDADEVAAMAGLFRRGLDLLADGGTATPVELVAPYRRGLPQPGRGASTVPTWTTVAEGFARQVARTPDAPALVSDGRSVSYAELDAHAAALAAELRARHRVPERDDDPCCVALHLGPSVEHVVALLALARLNVTIVPVDPSYPPALRRQVLDQVEPLCVLLPPGGDPEFDAVDPGRLARHPVVLSPAAPAPVPAAAPAHSGARPLYTLFTSGSTGVPKGVQVSDRTLANLLQWQAESGGLAGPAVTQQFSMLSFDVSFQEVFGTLCAGGRLHLVRPGWRQDAPALLEQLETAGVERVFMPYVALQLLAEHAVHLGRYPSRLREVVTAGEQLVCTEAIRRWFAGLPGARLFNHYGPTETHVVSSLCLDGDPTGWPERPAIGRPVANAVLTVVDEADEAVPPGRAGTLLIGGTMVARCYLGDRALNDARFVDLPGLGLCYRSGDRARFDHQGRLHFLGRDDDQIKLSGHRLELGQVEAALLRHPEVVNAVVVRDGEELVACLQCRGEAPTAEDLSAHLAPLLPGHVRIARFRVVGELPRTPSGKLDRRGALRSAGRDLRGPTASRTGLSAREALLTEVFEEVTGLAIDPGQTFFDAGASSLGLMRFQLRCTTEADLRFTVADLFEHVTVRALAGFLDRSATATEERAPHVATAAEPAEAAGLIASDGPMALDEPIAVVGMAVRLPGASDLAAFWRMVTTGGTGIEHFDAADGLVGARSQLDGPLEFDPDHFGISRQEARLMDPQQRHLLMSCVEALAHAGIADPSRLRVGLVAGAGESTYFQSMLREADPERLPDGFQLALHHDKDFLATKAAYHLGLTGPAFTTQAACASSLVAVHVAAGMLRQGDAEVMLAGGVLVDPTLTGGYRYQPQHIFSVDGRCRPFSDDAGGTIGASGVGMVVLKPLRLARRDGDTVYALITGTALNNDGSDKLSYSAPSLAGQREVIRAALRRSGRIGADLGYIEAHGTATRLGDPVEVGALRQAYDLDRSGHCALTSVKSQIGHLGAAAGVVGLVRAALAVHHGVIPPNIGFRALNPQLGADPTPFYIPTEARPWPADRERIAAVSSFGIGGTNAHAVLEADRSTPGTTGGAVPAGGTGLTGGAGPTAGEAAPGTDRPGPDTSVPPCLLLSSSSEAGLRADAARIADYLEARPAAYPQVLRHLQAGRPARRRRLAAVCPDASAAVAWLRGAGRITDAGAGEARTGAPVPSEGLTAEQAAAAWLSGERIDWPAGPAQAPWDFPPPAFELAEFDFPRATAAPAPAPESAPAPEPVPVPAGPAAAEVPRRLPEDAWLHQPHWARLRRAGSVVGARTSRLLVLLTDGPAPPEAVRAFEAAYARVVRVRGGEAFARRGDDVYEVDPADPASLGRLLDALAGTGAGEHGIDWLHALPLGIGGPVGRDSLARARWACLDTPAALVRAMAEADGPLRLRPWWLSYRARPVDGPVGRPEAGLLAGAVEVAPQEGAEAGRWVDLPGAEPAHWAAPLAALLAEADAATAADAPALPRRLALRRGHWWEQVTLPVSAAGPGPVGLPDRGVHLVLGGTGGIGRGIAAWLLENGAARVLLLARSPRLPEELTPWADRVELVEADLAESAPEEVMALVGRRTDRLDGVIHAVGVASGALIARRDAGAAARASAAKLHGALLVEQVIERYRPSVAVYCSSMSAELGGVGQFDYAAANSLLDGFAQYRSGDAETTVRLGVNWDVWSETGMALRAPRADARHRAHLSVGLTVAEGKRVFARAMGLQLPQVLVSTTDLHASRVFYSALPGARALVSSAPAVAAGPAGPALPVVPVVPVVPGGTGGTVPVSVGGTVETDAADGSAAALLHDWLCDWLDLDHIDPAAPLYDLGVDSLTLLDLIGVVKRHFDVELELTRFSHRVSLAEILTRLSEATSATAVGTEGVVVETWQQGTGPDVLCLVHPVGGDIQAYRSLVSALGPRLTVCLIADPALERPGTADWTLAERARRYAAALRAHLADDTRRLHLAGWSFGAWAVMGMAAEAEAIGRPVHGVHLIDPPPPGSGPLFQEYDDTQLQAVFAHELGQGGSGSGGPVAHGYAERLVRCCRANLRSMAEYRMPLLSATPSQLWLAERPVAGLPSPGSPERQRERWRPYLPEPSTWHRLDTTHYGIVRPPHVQAVAAAIAAASEDPPGERADRPRR
ncbi:amino acid adenylation domain-containing protein [Kitasatospora sp. NPDC005856]|uniref:amino acid adenylation domain-containing protein n=1 Tax=Kitasatospora sp. NPDC005856 TaxID=3154566 RepID=UPI0033C81C13